MMEPVCYDFTCSGIINDTLAELRRYANTWQPHAYFHSELTRFVAIG